MANPEHLKILKQGVEQWNKWRKKHPKVGPNLSKARLDGADLGWAGVLDPSSGTDLHDANLSGAGLLGANLLLANLTRADLGGADLHDARLSGADLRGANLRGANLRGAMLEGANLGRVSAGRRDVTRMTLNCGGADLRGANLGGTMLMRANLNGAKLSGADFTAAVAEATNFADVDLSGAKGLETIKHYGPSTIGIDTIYKSRGKIPEAFLRGCGVPDEFIAYIGSMVGRPIEFYSCFISYSSKDQEFAERLHADLQAKGVRCWFATEEMKGGRKLHEQIDEAIRLHDKLLLIDRKSVV